MPDVIVAVPSRVIQLRELTADLVDVSLRASRGAFGGPLPDRSSFKLGNGFRRWGIFDGPILLAAFDGITLAIDGSGQVSGYASWNRGESWGPEGVLTVSEIHAKDALSTEALLAVIGSFDAVTPTVKFRTSRKDPIQWLIPGAGWSIIDVKQYMLRVVDLAGAVAQRGWPAGLTATVDFTVDDPVCPWNSGPHRLVLDGGDARLEPGTDTELDIGPRGLAVLLAGRSTFAALRRAGLLTGGSSTDHRSLDAAMAGPPPAILDFF